MVRFSTTLKGVPSRRKADVDSVVSAKS